MKKCKSVVKLISADFSRVENGNYGRNITRINSKKPLKKIIKLCLKYNLPFQVSIRDTKVIDNMNYIEIYNSKMWREVAKLAEVLR